MAVLLFVVVISPSITFIALLLYLGQALRDSEADIERAIEAMRVMDGWTWHFYNLWSQHVRGNVMSCLCSHMLTERLR